jgi:hypothetical protein
MRFVALLRRISQIGVQLAMKHKKIDRSTNRRQGKSTAFGLVHVVGRIHLFPHRKLSPCWRYRQKRQRNQHFERQPYPFVDRFKL